MRNHMYSEVRPRLLLAFVSMLLLIAMVLTVFGFNHLIAQSNGRQIEAALSTLTYTEANADAELALLQTLTNYSPVSDASAGRLYQAATEVSYMFGDDMLYNRYIAHALYYLRKSGDIQSCVYLGTNYVGRLYANGCYESAWSVLTELGRNNDINALPPELQARYYLCCADVAEMTGNPPDAYLTKAHTAIMLTAEGGERELSLAKLAILTARAHILQGDFEAAQSTLSGYSETDNFGLGEGQVYVVCDFTIPYYELMSKLALHNGETDDACHYADLYLEACDEYSFRAMKLNLLYYIVSISVPAPSDLPEKYLVMEKEVAQQNLTEMTEEYGHFLLSDIDATTQSLDTQAHRSAASKRLFVISIIVIYALILLYIAAGLFVDHLNRDGLTGLGNRKKYEKIRTYCEKKSLPYSVILLDIDDFKQINDTFGHLQGDQVLRDISSILAGYSGRGISSYRYGGEELCMMLLRVSEKRAREIAEELRAAIESMAGQPVCHVTVSLGVATSHAGENVFLSADKKLYEAKGNGKNRVC